MFAVAEKLFSLSYEHHYMNGAFNVFNFDSLMAVICAAEEEQSPVIVQVSLGARKYCPDFPLFMECIQRAIEKYSVPILLQHDHCTGIDTCKEAIELGFPAVMFDGSHLPFKENIAKTKEIVSLAHARGVWLEAELGSIPGFEDDIFSDRNQHTTSEEAQQFIQETGCDALSVAVGTSHGGVLSDTSLPLAFDRLGEIHAQLRGFPLVLHGGASLHKELIDGINMIGAKVPYLRNVSEDDISKCRDYGVCKVNMDVDNFMVFTTAVRKTMMEKPDKYDPRIYLKPGRDAFREQVKHKMRNVLHSSHKADLFNGSKTV